MPTYEYECTECGHRFDVWQRATDEPISECESCAGSVRKVFHPVRVIFKGSGFHATDYGKNGGQRKAEESIESAKEKVESAASKED